MPVIRKQEEIFSHELDWICPVCHCCNISTRKSCYRCACSRDVKIPALSQEKQEKKET